MNPYSVTRDFESALCEYTGARYAVAVNSCTAALMLAVQWVREQYDVKMMTLYIEIPRRTYVSVPCAILNAGAVPDFRDEEWRGAYELRPTLKLDGTECNIWDCARRFTSGMYVKGQFQCVSFSASKILGAEQGGAILHDNREADAWFRRMRFDGRTEGVATVDDHFDLIGHHCLMIPSVAATLLVRLYHLPKHNEDLPEIEYPDLSKHPAFQ